MSLLIQSPHRALSLITNIESAAENSRKLSTSLNLKSLQVSELEGTILADIQDLRTPTLATPQSTELTQGQLAVVKAFLKANPLEDLAQPAGDSRRRSAAKEGKDGAPAATLHTTTDQLTINVMDIQTERAKTQVLDEQLKKEGIKILAQTSQNLQHFTSEQQYKDAGKDLGGGISNAVVSSVAASTGAVSSIRANKFHLKAHQHQKNIDAYGHIESKLNINNERLWKNKRIKFDSGKAKETPEPATSKPDISLTKVEPQKYHDASVSEKTIQMPSYEDVPKVTPQFDQLSPEVSNAVRPRALFVSGTSKSTSASVDMKTEDMPFNDRFTLMGSTRAQTKEHFDLVKEMKGSTQFVKAVNKSHNQVDIANVEHAPTLTPSAVVKSQKNNLEQIPATETRDDYNDLLLAPLSAPAVGVNKNIKPATSEPATVVANEAKTPQPSPTQNRKNETPFAVPEESAESPLPLPGQQQVPTEVKRPYSSSDDGYAVIREEAGVEATSTTPSGTATEAEVMNGIDWKNVPLPPPPPPEPPCPPAVREKVPGFELFGRTTKATYDMLQNARGLQGGLQGGLNAEFKEFAKTIFNSEGHLKKNWGVLLDIKAKASQHFLRTGALHPLHFIVPEMKTVDNNEKANLAISINRLEDIAKQMERKSDSFRVAEDALLELTKNKRLKDLPERNAQEIKDNLHDVRVFKEEAELLKNEYARELRLALNSDDVSMYKPHLIGILNRFNALKGPFMGAVNKTVRNLQQARTTIKENISIEQDRKVKAESKAKYLDSASTLIFQMGNPSGHLSQVSTALAMTSAVEKAKNGLNRSEAAKEMQTNSLRSDDARAEQGRKFQEEFDRMANNFEQSNKQMRGKLNNRL